MSVRAPSFWAQIAAWVPAAEPATSTYQRGSAALVNETRSMAPSPGVTVELAPQTWNVVGVGRQSHRAQ
jgi:hypothetical protein